MASQYATGNHTDRCKHCGSYVSKPPAEGGLYRYQCAVCGPVVEYSAVSP